MERELAARMCMDTGEQVVAKLGLQGQVRPLAAPCVMPASCRPLLPVHGEAVCLLLGMECVGSRSEMSLRGICALQLPSRSLQTRIVAPASSVGFLRLAAFPSVDQWMVLCCGCV
jgi:hypothetical protein